MTKTFAYMNNEYFMIQGTPTDSTEHASVRATVSKGIGEMSASCVINECSKCARVTINGNISDILSVNNKTRLENMKLYLTDKVIKGLRTLTRNYIVAYEYRVIRKDGTVISYGNNSGNTVSTFCALMYPLDIDNEFTYRYGMTLNGRYDLCIPAMYSYGVKTPIVGDECTIQIISISIYGEEAGDTDTFDKYLELDDGTGLSGYPDYYNDFCINYSHHHGPCDFHGSSIIDCNAEFNHNTDVIAAGKLIPLYKIDLSEKANQFTFTLDKKVNTITFISTITIDNLIVDYDISDVVKIVNHNNASDKVNTDDENKSEDGGGSSSDNKDGTQETPDTDHSDNESQTSEDKKNESSSGADSSNGGE